MSSPTLIQQTLIERIHDLSPEKVAEVADFVEFLAQRQEGQDAEDVAEARRRQAAADPSQHRTLDDLRQAWRQ